MVSILHGKMAIEDMAESFQSRGILQMLEPVEITPPQMPSEDIGVISAIFSGPMISEGDGK